MFVLVGQALWACESVSREIDADALRAMRRVLVKIQQGDLQPIKDAGLLREELVRARRIASSFPQPAILSRYAEAYWTRLNRMRGRKRPLGYIGGEEPTGKDAHRLYSLDIYLDGRKIVWIDMERTRPAPHVPLIKLRGRARPAERSKHPHSVRRGRRKRFKPGRGTD